MTVTENCSQRLRESDSLNRQPSSYHDRPPLAIVTVEKVPRSRHCGAANLQIALPSRTAPTKMRLPQITTTDGDAHEKLLPTSGSALWFSGQHSSPHTDDSGANDQHLLA